jgi:hypothetical protein
MLRMEGKFIIRPRANSMMAEIAHLYHVPVTVEDGGKGSAAAEGFCLDADVAKPYLHFRQLHPHPAHPRHT